MLTTSLVTVSMFLAYETFALSTPMAKIITYPSPNLPTPTSQLNNTATTRSKQKKDFKNSKRMTQPRFELGTFSVRGRVPC
ncbi:hypothetical protein BKA63DRAFT_521642 [Paraphoma chrysanthemicola]|nr:hypothetical protein BKA63DRAFT_521642 [Paraphoma chrysanthemicola]